jgi:cytochrome c biogenesis protein CcdA
METFTLSFLALSFFSGVLTVLAPCILPLLPVIIGTSAGARSKITPYVVIGALSLSILVFTYVLKASTLLIDIPQSFWAYFSGSILLLIGLTFTFPTLWSKVPGMHKLSMGGNAVVGNGYTKKSIWGDITIGAALGPVFSSCSPTYFLILAAVLPASFLLGTVYLLVYIAGLASVLLLIALLGQRFVGSIIWAADPYGWFKRGLGIVFLIVGLSIFTGLDKQFEALILDTGFNTTQFENGLLEDLIQ